MRLTPAANNQILHFDGQSPKMLASFSALISASVFLPDTDKIRQHVLTSSSCSVIVEDKMTRRDRPKHVDRQPQTYSIEAFCKLMGIGRNSGYAGAKRGEFLTVRIGKRLLVPKIEVERLLRGGSPTRS